MLFRQMGITISDVIRMMLVQAVAERALPFEVRVQRRDRCCPYRLPEWSGCSRSVGGRPFRKRGRGLTWMMKVRVMEERHHKLVPCNQLDATAIRNYR